jgi:transposase
LTPLTSYLSTKLPSRPTWSAAAAGACAGNAWSAMFRWEDWETLTFIAGFRQTGIVAPMVISGAMNGEAFRAYIERCLAPILRRRDIVVVDNVSFHRVAGAMEAIQACGAELRYLPPNSPEFNPIELVFHPLKKRRRKAAERTVKGLERSVGAFTRLLRPAECIGYFRHAGYDPL